MFNYKTYYCDGSIMSNEQDEPFTGEQLYEELYCETVEVLELPDNEIAIFDEERSKMFNIEGTIAINKRTYPASYRVHGPLIICPREMFE